MNYIKKFSKSKRPIVVALASCLISTIVFSVQLEAQPVPAGKQVSVQAIATALQEQIPALLKTYRVAGVQLAVFDKNRTVDLAIGMYAPGDVSSIQAAENSESLPIEAQTYFEAGEFKRPMLAVALLESLARSDNRSYAEVARYKIADLDLQVQQSVWQKLPAAAVHKEDLMQLRLLDIINHSSGLPLSRPRLLSGSQALEAESSQSVNLPTSSYAARDFQVLQDDQLTLRTSGAGYALLAAILESVDAGALQRSLAGAKGVLLNPEKCQSETGQSCQLARPMVRAGAKTFWMDHQDGRLEKAASMPVQARAVAVYLRNFMNRKNARGSAEHVLFENRAGFHSDLGGVVAGQHFGLLGQSPEQALPVFTMQSRRPGFSAVAFVGEDGRGLVLLSNSDRIDFLYYLLHGVYQHTGLLPRELPEGLPTQVEGQASILGGYRPVGIIPESQSWLAFLSDMTLFEVRNRIEMQSVFQKKTGAKLFPVKGKPDLFVLYGSSPSHGWRLRAVRDQDGDVVALHSDLLRYERVSRLASGWTIIVYMALVFFGIMALIFYYLWRRLPEQKGETK